MTAMDYLTATAFWILVFLVVMLVAAVALPVRHRSVGDVRLRRALMVLTICAVAEGVLLVVAIVNDLVIEPVKHCHAVNGHIDIVGNKGMPGCVK